MVQKKQTTARKRSLQNTSKNRKEKTVSKMVKQSAQRKKQRKTAFGYSRGNKQTRKRNDKKRWQSFKNVLVELTLVLFLFGLLLIPIFRFFVVFPEAGGYAMSPTLQDGVRTMVYQQGKVKRFSLVYFKVPQRNDGIKTIRRVIGLPGERVEYKDECLYINGEEKVERFLGNQLLAAQEGGYTLTENLSLEEIQGTENGVIPQGYYLVLGDNRVFSVDSREYGLVSEEEIIGTVELIF
ncbi:signal peptidase I [Enterococcus sp. BWR-S5]|uniref:signal peptidase I n=1 Tax=Enterococcus sp. BWR-S5 TaxID=2787714 RepID=UPI001923C511|nr:signal peptidase I [Enterococcus sp. BWR-S5]MBL1225817.1 signal peptidase I [Enterococcus sp. BWR-S5]